MANVRFLLVATLVLTIFSGIAVVNARIGMIFTGPNPLLLYGLVDSLNTLEGSFKIGNSELATEVAILTVRTDADSSLWAVQVSGNGTRLSASEIIDVTVTVTQQRELPRGTYDFTVVALLKPEVEPEGSMGVLQHTETVSIILRPQAELPSSTYSITVFTEPEVHARFQIDSGGIYSTPKCVGGLSAGRHAVQLLPSANYSFTNWENGESSTNREVLIDGKDLSIIAHVKRESTVSSGSVILSSGSLLLAGTLLVAAMCGFVCVFVGGHLVLRKKPRRHGHVNQQ